MAVALSSFLALPALAETRSAQIYPLPSEGLLDSEVKDLGAALQAGLLRQERTGNELTSGADELLAPSCGPARSATVACLAGLAGKGVVLRALVKKTSSGYALAITAVDARGEVFGPVQARVDAMMLAIRGISEAMEELGARVANHQSARALASAPATPKPSPPAQAVPDPTVAPAAPARAPLAATSAAPDVPGAWMEPAGKWTAAGGGALLVAGGVFGFLAKSLNDSLTDKYSSHTLAASDASSYGRVGAFSTTANVLFVAGGVAALTGLFIWAGAPDEPRPAWTRR
ncbi:MAG: hypothetical protein JST92_05795 [Deltaproteobacteria bacterium]|nr:hypothetical protein [Deltaproteobacteria bacterium]